eukprot:9834572-Lingulodinium_polyedra.AAC.1
MFGVATGASAARAAPAHPVAAVAVEHGDEAQGRVGASTLAGSDGQRFGAEGGVSASHGDHPAAAASG